MISRNIFCEGEFLAFFFNVLKLNVINAFQDIFFNSHVDCKLRAGGDKVGGHEVPEGDQRHEGGQQTPGEQRYL